VDPGESDVHKLAAISIGMTLFAEKYLSECRPPSSGRSILLGRSLDDGGQSVPGDKLTMRPDRRAGALEVKVIGDRDFLATRASPWTMG
jgi:hypothetical protein